MFLRNSWYVAAWDRELARDHRRQPLARTILGEPIVFYRQENGAPVALEDRCCHRHLPLSLGRLEGDTLRCGYHGLRFDPRGRCVEIPGQVQIPPDAAIRSYPLIERFGWVWIWMGDPKRADPALIADWWWMDHPDWACAKPDMIHVACNYQLINDNVLDVTHLVYVHASSIGNPSINDFPATTENDGKMVRLTRWIIDRPAPPMYQAAGNFAGNVDRWQIVEHQPPCFSVNFAGCAATGTGAPQGDRGKGIELMGISAPTPETERTTHYFFAFPRKFGLGDAALDKVFNVDFVNVFREDVAVLEAQQRMMELKPFAPSVSIKVDAAPLAARRLLDRLLAAEQPPRDPAFPLG
ncbi:MAG TPA: aromatic ring-hydroxylating dioxygenase subunit alpha [Stellaceae bacterium]|jgi:phenylpropionate dioxygenase-like ring-hydroxylating dioxygenase large terminal subunit|nr:aromatic ring-hydroxylating dioxygenase subunit alpha [Stellaceae bacterium]